MKMLPLGYWTTVICAVFIAQGAVSGEEVKVFALLGGTVSFAPTSINPPVTSIIWKHKNSSGIVVKAIEWDDDGFNIPNPRFKDITSLNEKTGQITITNLTVKHSGLYTIDINSKEQEQRFTLEFLAPVTKPVIKKEEIKVNPNAMYLICEYSETIIWKNSSGDILKGSRHSTRGELITVEKKGNPENYYTCTLKNAVSEETSDPVYERDLFEDSVPWWIALIVVFIPVFLAGLFVLLYKVWPWFHDIVLNNFGNKTYIGAFLNCLDGKKKNKHTEEEAASRNGTGIKEGESSQPLKADSDGGDKDDRL